MFVQDAKELCHFDHLSALHFAILSVKSKIYLWIFNFYKFILYTYSSFFKFFFGWLQLWGRQSERYQEGGGASLFYCTSMLFCLILVDEMNYYQIYFISFSFLLQICAVSRCLYDSNGLQLLTQLFFGTLNTASMSFYSLFFTFFSKVICRSSCLICADLSISHQLRFDYFLKNPFRCNDVLTVLSIFYQTDAVGPDT